MKHGRLLAVLILVALVATPGMAGKRKGKKKHRHKHQGGINPSSMTVIDDDFEMSAAPMEPEPFFDGRPTGAGVVVAVLDGGFNLRHPAIACNLAPYGFDAIDMDGDPHDTGPDMRDEDDDEHYDEDDEEEDREDAAAVGHGTFVAGMVLKNAPHAMIVPIRVRDASGFGTNEELIRGLDHAVAMGVDVINLSLDGSETRKRAIGRALKRARAAGIVVILAAGNDGAELVKNGMTRQSIVVGAAAPCGTVADFSNYSTEPEFGLLTIYAAGVELIGPMGACGNDASMGIGSGTSFSAGVVSGAVAAWLEFRPGCPTEELLEALRRSTDPAFHPRHGMLAGGMLNVERLVCE